MASRSLGTLTLDLVAKVGGFAAGMNKAEKDSQRATKEIAKAWSNAGKALSVFGAVANSAVAAYVVTLAKNAREIKNLAAASNTGAVEFQKFTAAAKDFGAEQGTVASVLTDVSKKVGEFLQVGGGPLKDFFENIAPQIGVTAEEFRNLSGPDALLKYVGALEKANLSQDEFNFYLDKISGQAINLAPLLRNNGQRLKELGDQAQKAGVIMNDFDISQLIEVDENIKNLKLAFEGMTREVTTAAIPAINDLIKVLSDPDTIEAAKTLGSAIVSVMTGAAKAIRATIGLTQFLAEELASKSGIALDDTVRRLERIAKLENEITKAERAIANARNEGQKKVLQKVLAEIEGEIQSLRDQQKIYEELSKPIEIGGGTAGAGTGGTVVTPTKTKTKTKAELDAIKEQEKAYQAMLRELRTEEEKINDTLRERLAIVDATTTLTKDQRDFAIGRIADAATEDSPEINADKLDDSAKELERWYQQQLELLQNFRKERADLTEYWDEEEKRVKEEHEKRLSEIAIAEEAERNKQIAKGYGVLLDAMGKYYEGMQGERAAYARAAIAIGSALLDDEKRKSLQSIFMNTYDAAMKAYNSLSGIPYVGPVLGAAAYAGIVAAGLAAAAKVTGMAHDGLDSVPEDGTWLLQKGERVTTEKTSKKLDGTLNAVQTQLRQRNEYGGEPSGNIRIINAFEPSVVGDYLGSDEGERRIINVVRRNQRALQNV